MVVVMVAVTILTVLTAAALPMWSQAMKREKEEELIFRGWQYAEAIRVFQQRHGRYPTRLQELIEVKPRSIRRLWKDPMTENGAWQPVFQGASGPQVPGSDPTRPDGQGGTRGDGRDGRRPGNRPGSGPEITTGPIVGVRSRSDDESIKVLFGEETYAGWLFTVERLTAGAGSGNPVTRNLQQQFQQGGAGPLGPPPAKWIGRPFPPGIEPAQDGGLPGGPSGLPGEQNDDKGRELGGGKPPGR